MIERKDIIKGTIVQLSQELILVNNKNYEEKTFPINTLLTISYLSQEKNNPNLTLSDGTHSYYSRQLSFKNLCETLTIQTPANEHHIKLHEKKLNQIQVLKQIKKVAVKDDLAEVLKLVDTEYFKSIKSVKTLMMYAIKSKGLKILTYGFQNKWFKKIDFNDNVVATGETVGTPLYYAITKSNKETQQYLIEQGASMQNKTQKNSQHTIEDILEHFDDEAYDLIDFEKIVQEKRQLSTSLKPSVEIQPTKIKL